MSEPTTEPASNVGEISAKNKLSERAIWSLEVRQLQFSSGQSLLSKFGTRLHFILSLLFLCMLFLNLLLLGSRHSFNRSNLERSLGVQMA